MTGSFLHLLYLDPSTGGILLQAILGGVTGGLVLLKLFWRRIHLILFSAKGRKLEKAKSEALEDEN